MDLVSNTEIKVRFCEVDSMGIVWHGNYIKYLEDGREDFGTKYTLGYMDIFRNGFYAPLVKINCDYKRPLQYEEKAIVETTFVNTPASKIVFKYKIYTMPDKLIILTGETVQVFLDKNFELVLTYPPFFEEWKKRWNLI